MVEDDENDALMLGRAMRLAACSPSVTVVKSAEDAVKYLTGADEFSDRNMFPLPSLVVLDLRLPGTSGLDFLSWLQGQPNLSRAPVVVLSGSPYAADVWEAYKRGAKTFFTKPDGRDLDRLAQSIVLYWSASISPISGQRRDDGSGSPPMPLE